MLFRHTAVAFSAMPAAPKTPPWSLLVACEAADLLTIVFLASGLEKPAQQGV